MKLEPQVVVALAGVAILVAFGLRQASGRRRPRYMSAFLANATRPEVQRAILAEFGKPPDAPQVAQRPVAIGAHDGHGGSVFCPSCRADYPAGTPYCECCGLETADPDEFSPPVAGSDPPAHQEPLVVVHVAGSPTQASVLKMYLESHAIDCITRGHVPSGVYNFTISPLAEVQLLVRESDTARARALLLECQ